MPEWWNEIPMVVKVVTSCVIIFLAGMASVPYVQLPQQASENESAIADVSARVDVIESAFTQLVSRLDRYFCVQLAEAEGTSTRACQEEFGTLVPGRRP